MDKELFYNSIAQDFDSVMNMYDTNRRIEVIFDDFLKNEDLNGKTLLDGGCGTGWFTKVAIQRGANVTSIDISKKLVQITKDKNPTARVIECSILEIPFPDNSFDYVISSDVIEHTPNPLKAAEELIRILKPKGKLCITVPNKSTWYFTLFIANLLKIRKYQGYENWQHYYKFKKFLKSKNIRIICYKGIHLFPFVIRFLNPLLHALDKLIDNSFGILKVNIAVLAEKNRPI
jgi:ubiquinone/menaquinone biosynthesis C-methylase UbiE